MPPTAQTKVHSLVEQLLDADDEQLRELVGPLVPIPLVRGLLPYAPRLLPGTAEELEAQLDKAQAFIDWLRDDSGE